MGTRKTIKRNMTIKEYYGPEVIELNKQKAEAHDFSWHVDYGASFVLNPR